MLRIDVDNGDPYAVPANNPFVRDDSARSEIWAFGLRNPWRFSFDRLTGDLYIGDVGEYAWEEIDYQPAASHGGENYGWNISEGPACFQSEACDMTGLTPPIASYSHDEGCAVIGGYVYRGQRYPQLAGHYFFADFCQGAIWSLLRDDNGRWRQTELFRDNLRLNSFGEDHQGELYVVSMAPGVVFQIRDE